MKPVNAAALGLLCASLLLAACHGKDGATPTTSSTASSSATASPTPSPSPAIASVAYAGSATAAPFPSYAGYSGTVNLTSAIAPSNTSLTISTTNLLPGGLPSILSAGKLPRSATSGDTGVFYIGVTLTQTTVFSGLPGFTITLPSIANPVDIHLAFYDPTNSSPAWSYSTYGTPTINGQTVTFGSGGNATFVAGKTYYFALYASILSTPTASPSPTPSATPTASPTPSATPTPAPTATPTTPSAQATFAYSGTAVAAPMPTYSGYSATANLTSAIAGTGTTLTLQSTTSNPIGLPSIMARGRVPRSTSTGNIGVFYMSITAAKAVTFNAFPGFAVTFPSIGNAINIGLAFYDPTASSPAWNYTLYGTPTLAGNTVTFTSPTGQNANFIPGVTYWFAVYASLV